MRRIVIAGTGRAGTTLLVQLLDDLGLDTGAQRLSYSNAARAGLEARLIDPDAPKVVKDPTIDLRALFEAGSVAPEQIERIVLPVRKLSDAATSRLRRSADALSIDADGGVTGTVWRPWSQRNILAQRVHGVVVAAAEHDIPLTIIHYPRFALDLDYAYRRLAVVAGGVRRDDFERVWQRVVRPDLVQEELPALSVAERYRLGLAILRTSARRGAVRLIHWTRRQRVRIKGRQTASR